VGVAVWVRLAHRMGLATAKWVVAAVRSEALMVLVYLSGRQEWGWVCRLPWVAWL
jgi:hypothetical protein